MKLHLAPNEGLKMFSAYGAGYVAVGHVRYEHPVVVSPQSVVAWAVTGFEALQPGDFGVVASLRPEIVLLGTGSMQRFPRAEIARGLAEAGAGVEVMDTRAACRTYNILAAEGRKVVAAVLLCEE